MTDIRWPSVTVAILTFNGDRYLDDILVALAGQRYEGSFEVLVIDSGSTDSTLAIVARYPEARLHTIPNSEFGHGRTRNLAVAMSNSDVVAMLTHDAVPAHDRWLAELVRPLADDLRIAAVVGKQVARSTAPPIVKYDIQRAFQHLGRDEAVSVTWRTDWVQSDAEIAYSAFFSDANAAIRRTVVAQEHPYQDVDYAEDQQLARDLLDGGYRVAYAPRGAVVHSNDTTLRTFGTRVASDLIGLRKLGTPVARVSRVTAMKQWLKFSVADTALIVIDRDFSGPQKLRWLLVNPWFHAAKWSAYRRASRSLL